MSPSVSAWNQMVAAMGIAFFMPLATCVAFAQTAAPQLVAHLFGSDTTIRQTTLWLPYSYYERRLSGFRLHTEMQMHFARGSDRSLAQTDVVQLSSDGKGLLRLDLTNPTQQLHVVQKNQLLWISYGHGPMRRKNRADMDLLPLLNQSVRSTAMAWRLVEPAMHLQNSSTSLQNGRKIWLFNYQQHTKPQPVATIVPDLPFELPILLLPSWYAESTPIDLKAQLRVDADTGLLWGSDIQATWMLPAQGTQVALHFTSAIHLDQAGTKPTPPPRSVEEFARVPHSDANAMLQRCLQGETSESDIEAANEDADG